MAARFLPPVIFCAALAFAGPVHAQAVQWGVSSYGPPAGNAAYVGCGGCYSDQFAIAIGPDGNPVVTGAGWNGANFDWKTVKFNAATGAVLWEALFNGTADGYDVPYALAIDSAGNVVVAGESGNADFNSDFKVIKYAAATGAVVWERTFNGAANSNDAAYAVAVDGADNVIATGITTNAAANVDWKTIQYTSGGTQVWEKTFDGPGGGHDYANAIAVDAAGNAFVTGSAANATDDDWKTIKYAAADGAIVWEKALDASGAAAGDSARGVRIDSAGNAVVIGYVSTTSFDWKIIKYAAADGTILWQQSFDGGADDHAYGHVIDAAGNVIVTGAARNAAGNFDYKTIKYAAASGALLWEKTFAGAANGRDVAVPIALDGAGNAIVSGASSNGVNDDIKTIKYASSNGAVLWQQLYNGTADGTDRGAAVVAGPGAVFLAGESTESGAQIGWRVMKLANSNVAAAIAKRHDFNADLRGDVLFRRNDGANYVWMLDGASINGGVVAISSQGLLPSVDSTWFVAGIGDFNGDGKADILWRNLGGTNYVWHLDGSTINGGVLTIVSQGILPSVDASWSVAGIGDFNGDGKSDILWRRNDGANYVWMIDGASISGGVVAIASQGLLPGVPTDWAVAGIGDFNGDGKSDILWRRTDGTNYVWHVDGSTINAGVLSISSQGLLPGVDTSWAVVATGDYNGDGKSDVFFRKTDGTNYVWHVNGAVITGGVLQISSQGLLPGVDTSWTVVGQGDYNGDGKGDVFWRRNDGTNYLWHVDGATINGGVLAITSQGILPSVDLTWQVVNPK